MISPSAGEPAHGRVDIGCVNLEDSCALSEMSKTSFCKLLFELMIVYITILLYADLVYCGGWIWFTMSFQFRLLFILLVFTVVIFYCVMHV